MVYDFWSYLASLVPDVAHPEQIPVLCTVLTHPTRTRRPDDSTWRTVRSIAVIPSDIVLSSNEAGPPPVGRACMNEVDLFAD